MPKKTLWQQLFTAPMGTSGGGPGPFYTITIWAPGAYKLTSDLSPPLKSMIAIKVKADNVTIDLNGYSIIGEQLCPRNNSTYVIDCGGALSGVSGIDARGTKGLVVRNGRIKGFYNGISSSGDVVVEDLMLLNNRYGLFVSDGATVGATQVARTEFSGNQSALCMLSGGAVVTDSVFSKNDTAVQCGAEPTSFYNSYFVSNRLGFGIWVDPYPSQTVSSGPYGLSTVLMRDNKQNSAPSVAFY